jgi:hypothetical protein
MAVIQEVLLDTITDTARILPFLFLTYLLMEWMEHETGNKMIRFLENHRKTAPLAGALFGLVPECGFSSAASSLYTTGVISGGALASVYLSTSDEMLPLLLSSGAGAGVILPILAVKFIVALIAGFAADHFAEHKKTDIESFCEREHCDCEDGILKSAVMHTLKITVWLLAVTFLINLIMDSSGNEVMRTLIVGHPAVSVLTCTLLGMIPSCASSILLTTLYMEKVISFAAVCAGLLANAGVGMMVLFRVNPNMKHNIKIVMYVWAVSFVTGLILNLF